MVTMRLSFDMMCLAAAACMVGSSPVGRIEGPIERHLRTPEPTQEKRILTGNLNPLSSVEKLDLGESSGVENVLDASNSELQRIIGRVKIPIEGKLSTDDLQNMWEEIYQVQRTLIVWDKEVEAINAKHANLPITLFKVLMSAFGNEGVEKISAIAMMNARTSRIAMLLELMRYKIDPDDVLIALQRDSLGGNLFEHPFFSTWIDHVDAFNKEYNVEKPVLARLGYRDDELVNMLYDGTTNPSTSKTKAKVLDELLKLWLDKEDLPQNVFLRLGLHTNQDYIDFDGPRFTDWIKYVTRLYGKNGYPCFVVLESMYGRDSLMKMLLEDRKLAGPAKTIVANSYMDYLSKLQGQFQRKLNE